MKLEPHVNLILQKIIGEIFDEAHSNNYIFSKLEGRIFGGITVTPIDNTIVYQEVR